MKGKTFFIFFFFVISAVNIFSAEPDEILESANEYYKSQKYNQAIGNYEQLVNQGYQSENLFYNLANSYFRVGKIGLAILYYEKALKMSPRDEDIKYNLDFVNSKTIDKVEPIDTPIFMEWWYSFINIFSVNGWTLTAYLFYFFALLSATIYFFSKISKYQKIGFFSAMILGIMFLFVAFFTFAKIDYDSSHQFGIVVESSASAKLSPDKSSGDAFVIHEGTKVNLQDQIDEWIKIKLADGKTGWLNESDVKII